MEIIRTLLQEWRERKLPEIFPREIAIADYASMKPVKLIAITGFRRTGKTYLLFDLARHLLKGKSREEIVYLNFEDERIPLKTQVLTDFLPTAKQTFAKKIQFLLLDEIQNIPDWSKWVRRIYDTEDLRIFVSGSSSKVSTLEIPTELRGRFLEINVLPLSFKEFLSFRNIQIDFKNLDYSDNERGKIANALREYLEFGGMPEVVLAPEGKKTEIIHNYYNTLIRRDLIEKFKIRNEESLKALLSLLLNSTAFTETKLYNTLKSLGFRVGKGTVQNYLSLVEKAYFLHSLAVASPKVKDRLQHPRKAYFIDNGFIAVLSSRFSKNYGRLYENLVFIELKRRKASDPTQDVAYWKNFQKEEVDFVVLKNSKVSQLIQVSYDIEDYDTRKRETTALIKASKELKNSNLLVITRDKEGKEKIKGKTIKFIPLWKWLLQA